MTQKQAETRLVAEDCASEPAPTALGEPDPGSEAAPAGADRLVTRAQAAVALGLTGIERALAVASTALGKKLEGGDTYDAKASKAASHVAWLTKHAAQIMGELRKGEVHDQAQLRKLTLPIVLEWYRQLAEDDRAKFLRMQERIDRVKEQRR